MPAQGAVEAGVGDGDGDGTRQTSAIKALLLWSTKAAEIKKKKNKSKRRGHMVN